jgi:hypothetical protein
VNLPTRNLGRDGLSLDEHMQVSLPKYHRLGFRELVRIHEAREARKAAEQHPVHP